MDTVFFEHFLHRIFPPSATNAGGFCFINLPIPLAVVHLLLGRRLLYTDLPFTAMKIDVKIMRRGQKKTKIKISFSDEEREDARRLADTVRQLFPRLGKVKESKKPEDKYGHIYIQDSKP